MYQTNKSNEENIFDAIQDLKDSIFGLKNSYVQYCYSQSDTGLAWDDDKSNLFIKELLKSATNTKTYKEEFNELVSMVFEIAIEYIRYACNFEEQLFVSLRKIIKTTEKYTCDELSTFEIMIDRQKQYFDLIYLEKCKEFSVKMIEVEFDDFYKCCKNAIEQFIDEKNLNTIYNDRATREIVSRVNRVSNIVAGDIRKNAEVYGVYKNE